MSARGLDIDVNLERSKLRGHAGVYRRLVMYPLDFKWELVRCVRLSQMGPARRARRVCVCWPPPTSVDVLTRLAATATSP